jgi:hypothetical protein
MERKSGDASRLTLAIRWTARVWAFVTMVIVSLLSVGEGVHPGGRTELVGVALYPGGICLGMVLAWWKEGLGGGVTVASLAGFYVLYMVTKGSLPPGWAWLILAVPGFLFLWCWIRSRHPDARPA